MAATSQYSYSERRKQPPPPPITTNQIDTFSGSVKTETHTFRPVLGWLLALNAYIGFDSTIKFLSLISRLDE